MPLGGVVLLLAWALASGAAPSSASGAAASPPDARGAPPAHHGESGAAGDDAPHRHGHTEHPGHAPARDDDATMRHRFDDVQRWVARFDDPERATWQRPAELVAWLGVAPGQVVADIGAGTGYFNAHWARAVGPDGAVLAVDVEPAMVAYMRDRARREATPNVVPILGSPDNPRLPPRSVDWIVLVDTYHHIDARRDYFRRLHRAARPGARLVVVDFVPGPLPVGPPPGHKIAPDRVQAELTAAGWALERRWDGLPYQYVLVFRQGD